MPDHKIRTLLAFDFGMRHIGVAVGQDLTGTASPLSVLLARDGVPDWEEIRLLIDQWHADGLIVGLPLNMDETAQAITFAAKKFAQKCHGRFGLPVYLVDERLTSVEAKRDLQTLRKKSLRQSERVDSYAAKLILESWLRNN